MHEEPHNTLCSVLDSEDGAAEGGGNTQAAGPQLDALLQEEHEARLKAEALSQDQIQRLVVHSEQVAEYAQQKAADLSELQQQAEELKKMLEMSEVKAPEEFASSLKRLFQFLGDASSDASAFSQQAQEDAKRHKVASPAAEGAEAAQEDAASDKMDADPPLSNGVAGAPAEPRDQAVADAATADEPPDGTLASNAPAGSSADTSLFAARAKFIPMRLTFDDRRLFRLLEAALSVSDYTDKVDVLTWKRKEQRVVEQVRDICSILSGLVVAQDYRKGQDLVKNRDFKKNAAFFQHVFEIGRRYKIMNPDRMRSTYGKLLYMLMDTASPHVEELLEFSCIKPLTTVYEYLKERGADAMLSDPLMAVATAEIASAGRPRHLVQSDVQRKERTRKTLAKRFASASAKPDELLDAIYSFSDNNTYLLFNRDPVERMIKYLKHFFQAREIEDGWSLAISSGKGGARLSHNHERQYAYVLQSLSLWSEIATDMFRLWHLAESDLLSETNRYRLSDTGQGLNRVQSAPRVGKAMANILSRCQTKVGSWVGSSVVHLGDANVPNALMFIDKYTQVPRILNPVVQVLDDLSGIVAKDPKVAAYVQDAFGGVEDCRKLICLDFFRHAFDGSGADNFFDAGSCIDGRLTSAWNWCAKLEKKPYYMVFKMAGFVGFDGEFR